MLTYSHCEERLIIIAFIVLEMCVAVLKIVRGIMSFV